MASDLVGILGKKRSGKDTLANALVANHGFTKISLADPLRAMLLALDPWVVPEWGADPERLRVLVTGHGWDGLKDTLYGPEVRRLLQRLGTEAVRDIAGSNFWALLMIQAADRVEGPVVVPDVRFPEEYDAIDAAGGFLLRIVGRGEVGDGHSSETAVDHLPVDYEFRNTAGLDQVERYAAGVAAFTRMGRADRR